jgi:hypothetical protein
MTVKFDDSFCRIAYYLIIPFLVVGFLAIILTLVLG